MSLVFEVAVVLLVTLLLARLIPFLREQWRAAKILESVPGPRVYPLFGSFYAVRGPIEELMDRGVGFCAKYGHIFKFRFAHWCAVVVTDPDDLQVVFTSPHTQNKVDLCYDMLDPMLGMGLINLNGETHHRHRKAITASLHLQILQDFVFTFRSNALKLARRLETFADSGRVFDVVPFVGNCANLNVCETVLSTHVTGILDEKRESYVRNAHKSTQLMFWRSMRPWYWSELVFRMFSSLYKDYYAVASAMSDYVTQVLELKISQVNESKTKPTEKRRETFLEHFLRSEDSSVLNKSELVDELRTLMFGASETTTALISCFLFCVSIHPNIQHQIHEELDHIFKGDRTRQIEHSDLSRMNYLEQVLKEVLRFFPSAPIFGRQATEDIPLPSGYTLPKGTAIVIHPPLTHRNEAWFPFPDRFDPDRFLPDAMRGRHPYVFIPFSAGNRGCIGQRYGMMFAKTLAATMLRKYTVLPDPNGPKTERELKLTVGVTLTVTNGANIRLQYRDNNNVRNGEKTTNENMDIPLASKYGRT